MNQTCHVTTSHEARALVAGAIAEFAAHSKLLGRVLAELLEHAPVLPSADEIAHDLALPHRFALNRALRKEALPPFLVLRSMVWAVLCLARLRVHNLPLDRQAWLDGAEGSAYYRRLKSIAGEPWSEFAKRSISGGLARIDGVRQHEEFHRGVDWSS